MKIALLFYFLLTSIAFAETWDLHQGKAVYEVKHLLKRVYGESKALKGKIQCTEGKCDFLIAVPVKSFTSSDSNRDQNMLNITEAGKYPYAIAKGKVSQDQLTTKGTNSIPLEIEFHGKKASYQTELKVTTPGYIEAVVIIDLNLHQVERPSLFGIKIDEKVPLNFTMSWVKK